MRLCVSNQLRSSGFTLVESVMSMLIVSILLVAAVRATGASGLVQYKTAEKTAARLLADGLMSDITALPYEDPIVTPLFGVEAGETSTSKANYDDIDDFNGWTESPPQDKDGNTIPNFSTWSRSVVVERVNSATPSTVAGAETGAKRITVTVKHNNVVVLTRVAVRAKTP